MFLQSNSRSDVALSAGTFTHDEILQQPELWPTTLKLVAESGWPKDGCGRRTLINGAGTSASAASAIARCWPNADAAPATELLIESKAEIASRWSGSGALGVGIAPEGADASMFDECIPASAGQIPDELRTPFQIPPAQPPAYHLSRKEGLDPDNPSPKGAITRVVPNFVTYDEATDV